MEQLALTCGEPIAVLAKQDFLEKTAKPVCIMRVICNSFLHEVCYSLNVHETAMQGCYFSSLPLPSCNFPALNADFLLSASSTVSRDSGIQKFNETYSSNCSN